MSDADLAEAQAFAAQEQPAHMLDTSAEAMFSSSYDAVSRNLGDWSQYYNMSSAMQTHLDMVKEKTGEIVANPLAGYTTNRKAPQMLEETAQHLSKLTAKYNDPSLLMPTNDVLYEAGIQKAHRATREYESRAAGASTLTGRAAGVLGGVAAASTDIETAALNMIGFAAIPQGGPLVAATIRSAAGYAAGQLAASIVAKDFKQAVNPDYGFGDIATEVALAGGLGAGVHLGGASVGAIWRRFHTASPTVAAAVPQPIKDIGNIAERAEDLEANNPFKTGLTGAVAHKDAIAQIALDLVEGKTPTLSPLAQAEASARTGQVFLGNRAVDVKYELVDARDLVTSHTRDFIVNPNYPAELQPRARASAAARAQVIEMGSNLEPSRLGPSPEANAGAPLIGPDNIVESGNGRVMAIRNAYSEGRRGASAYRAFLEQEGYDTAGFNHPVLVARRVTAMAPDERAAFARSANASASLRMSTAEQAINEARLIGSEVAALLKPGDVGGAANRDFAKAFVGKLPIGERGGFLAQGGNLSAAGVQRLRAAAVARAYGDPAFIAQAFEHPEPNIKTIAGALSETASEWIRLRDGVTQGIIPSTHDITPDLMNAVKTIIKARDARRPVSEFLNQGDFFHSDTAALAIKMFFKDNEMKRFLSKGDMVDNLSAYARDIRTSAEGGPGLFGQEPITPKEVLAAQERKMRAPPVTKEELIEIEKSPELQDVLLADLRRDIDRGDAIIGMTEDGKPILADPEVHAAELQESLAKEIYNCAVGGVE